ncbi:MAG: response regulator transcription factor [Gemmatimonadota bacterium]
MHPETVLIIDDELQIRRVVRNTLEQDGLRVVEAATGREGADLAAAQRPDLIVLDLGLPDMSGLAICQELRAWSRAPVLVLSARHSDTEKATLLDAGADDYVTKPFSPVELRARVRAQLRRARLAGAPPTSCIRSGALTIDLERRVVTKDGATVHLTPTEWALLRVLVFHRGRTLTHSALFADVWGHAHGDAQQHLRVHVASLRRKLESDAVRPQHLITEPGVGYRFASDD